MRCITNKEVSKWLAARKIPESPWDGVRTPERYIQFYPPPHGGSLDAFTRSYFELINDSSESLVHITDWALYRESEMASIVGVRASHSESRQLIDAPGHILHPGEQELGASLWSLCVAFGWSSYLYSPRHQTTLYNWEGEIFDFWTANGAVLNDLRSLMKRFALSETQ